MCVIQCVHCIYDGVVALYLGIKMFIIEYLYNRFPRFKLHHDTVYKIWRQLPTDAILEDQYKRSLVDRVRSLMFCDNTSNGMSGFYALSRFL